MSDEKIWNELAAEYDKKYNSSTDWKLGYPSVEKILGSMNKKTILDYGCASGKFSRRMRNLKASVIAVDESYDMIERAKLYDKRNIDFQVIENDNLSFIKSESIDSAVATFVFCTMRSDDQVKRIAWQIYEKLVDNGSFVILEPHPEALGHNYVSMRREKPQKIQKGIPIKVELTGMNVSFYDYWRGVGDYVDIFSKSEFKINEIVAPIVENDFDELFWKDERVHPPFLIIHLKKEKNKN